MYTNIHRALFTFLLLVSTAASAQQVKVPAALNGQWLQPENNEWLVSFAPDFAVYKSEFWNYKSITRTKYLYAVNLIKAKRQKTLYVQVRDSTTVGFGETMGRLQAVSKSYNPNPVFNNYDTIGFTLPLLVRDSFTLTGWMQGYAEKKMSKVISVLVGDLLTDSYKNYIGKVDRHGRFSIKFPLMHPTRCLIDWSENEGLISFFALPGEALEFTLLPPDKSGENGSFAVGQSPTMDNETEVDPQPIFMGASARLNTEYNLFIKERDRMVDEQNGEKKGILPFEAYRQFRLDQRKKLEAVLARFAAKHKTSKQLRQIVQQEAKVDAALDILQSRFRKEDKTIDTNNMAYMAVIKQDGFTDEFSLLAAWYPWAHKNIKDINYTMRMQKLNDLTYVFDVGPDSVYQIIKNSGETITKDDVSFYENRIRTGASKRDKNRIEADSIRRIHEAFDKRHLRTTFKWIDKKAAQMREEASLKMWNEFLSTYGSNFFTDAILYRRAVADMAQNTLPAENVKAYYDAHIGNPIINAEWRNQYNELANKINGNLPKESNMAKASGSAPLLQRLFGPYKGKVVYVDFWAPWCMPCMEQLKIYTPQLEQETQGKDVVYLFLGIDCAEESWKNTIKVHNIKGEHYLLTHEEGIQLKNQFQIAGIPHYVLVNKQGEVTNSNAPRPMQKEEVLAEMTKLLNQK